MIAIFCQNFSVFPRMIAFVRGLSLLQKKSDNVKLTVFALRWGSLALPVILCLFLLISFVDVSWLLPAQNIDTYRILRFIKEQEYMFVWNSYTATAYLFSFIPYYLLPAAVFLVGVVALSLFIWPLVSRTQIILASFLTIAPILLILTRPVKDTVVILLTIWVLYLIRSRMGLVAKIAMIILIYSLYAYFVRQYYFLNAFAFLLVWIFINCDRKTKALMILFGIGVFFAIPGNIFMELQGVRDLHNMYRIGSGEAGHRTAFVNALPPTDAINFIVNYLVAAFRLNFSFLFYPGIRELFLTLNVLIYLFLIRLGINSDNVTVRLAAALLTAHILVLWIFEPDLGSYLRHLSSLFLYLTPIIVALYYTPVVTGQCHYSNSR
jgi:hypothetical protein